MKRLLALHFPQWALQRVIVARPELSDGRALILFARDARRGAMRVNAMPLMLPVRPMTGMGPGRDRRELNGDQDHRRSN